MIYTGLVRIRVPSANLKFVLPAPRKSSKRNFEWAPVPAPTYADRSAGCFHFENKPTSDSVTVIGSNLVLILHVMLVNFFWCWYRRWFYFSRKNTPHPSARTRRYRYRYPTRGICTVILPVLRVVPSAPIRADPEARRFSKETTLPILAS
jgi:hypothetical protein